MSEQDAGTAGAVTDSGAVSIEDTMAKVFDRVETNNGSDRGDNGQYTAADKDKTAGAGNGDADKNSSDASAAGTQGAAQPLTPPQSWSDADKALFAKAPPEVQKAILDTDAKRTEGVNRELEKIATERKRYEGLNPVLAPIEAEARKYGLTADVAVKQMFERHVDLQTRGIDALKDLAKLYGIKLDGVSGAADSGDVDPEIAALKSEIATLKSELGGFKTHQSQATRTAVERDMDAVRDEKGTDGKPLRPHFEALYDDMAPIAADLRAKHQDWPLSKIFSEAYERAVHANPETRAKVLAELRAKEKAEEERQAKEAAKGARKAADNLTRATGVHTGGAAKSKSIEETMGRVYDEAAA
jgi:hypothetical protein